MKKPKKYYKAELVTRLRKHSTTLTSLDQTRTVVREFVEVLTELLDGPEDKEIVISGFGTLKAVMRGPHRHAKLRGRGVKEFDIVVTGPRRLVSFVPSKILKDRMNSEVWQ